MQINQYLDSTYLKTSEQANISIEETTENVTKLVEDAVEFDMKLVMIRTNYIKLAKEIITSLNANVLVGTVIGFHEGNYSLEEKFSEAKKAIALCADELDFVINYEAFKNGNIKLVKEEVLKCSEICLKNNKVVKWIIETAALTNEEIIVLSQLIRDVVLVNFKDNVDKVFVKSSTGFFKTENNKPNGATFEAMELIVKNASPLKIKAAGGVRTFLDAKKMIEMGVDRIGTSSAKKIILNKKTENNY